MSPLTILPGSALLAASSIGSRMRGGSANTMQMLIGLAVICLIMAIVGGGIYVANHKMRRRRAYSHDGLFRALCRAHGLSAAQRQLLRQLSRMSKTTYPAQIFTNPGHFHPKRIPAPLAGRVKEIVMLANHLFPRPSDSEQPAAGG